MPGTGFLDELRAKAGFRFHNHYPEQILDQETHEPVNFDAADIPQIVRGTINANGTIASGTGFTVGHPQSGEYVITFDPVFAAAPVVVASLFHQFASGAKPTIAVWGPTTSQVTVLTGTVEVAIGDAKFTFIAVAV